MGLIFVHSNWPASVASDSLFDKAELTWIVSGVEVKKILYDLDNYIIFISCRGCEATSSFDLLILYWNAYFSHSILIHYLSSSSNLQLSGSRRTIPLRCFYDQGWSTLLWWITHRKGCSANSCMIFFRIDTLHNIILYHFLFSDKSVTQSSLGLVVVTLKVV